MGGRSLRSYKFSDDLITVYVLYSCFEDFVALLVRFLASCIPGYV